MDINRIYSYYLNNKSKHLSNRGSMWDTNIVPKHSSKLFQVLNTKNKSIISNVLQNISNTDICLDTKCVVLGFMMII